VETVVTINVNKDVHIAGFQAPNLDVFHGNERTSIIAVEFTNLKRKASIPESSKNFLTIL
jgi:hypothetical protein